MEPKIRPYCKFLGKELERLTAYFDYPPEISRIIYTTKLLEGFNRQLRKVTKNRSVFPNDQALQKLL